MRPVDAGVDSRTTHGGSQGNVATIDELFDRLEGKLLELVPLDLAATKSRAELAELLDSRAAEFVAGEGIELSDADRRELGTGLLNTYMELHGGAMRDDPLSLVDQAKRNLEKASSDTVNSAKELIHPQLLEHIDASAATELARHELAEEISDVVGELLVKNKVSLNSKEQRDLVSLLLNDMLGLGPLEPLLADESITDIMVNGANQVWVERGGKLVLTDVRFRDEQHLLNIATRIVTAVGRRVDESQPICDARLADGSRVNVIIPPLAIDGASISIRKFAKKKITLDKMVETRNLSDAMARVLKIAGRCRLNILISGGTGSGKTTMLNAISRMIDEGERTVTIEDAAELQLQQPHVVRLETRPPNLEGHGEINMRDLVKNALRMRPDRIILGEIRGSEAIDMLQAMNTGHDGSLGTIHANRPREALTRLENMVNMAGMNLPAKAIRTQIADALHMIVQVSRMRDGVRRVQYITEVVGMEGDVITTQDLFNYQFTGEDENGKLLGEFVCSGVRPHFYDRAEYFGLGRALMEAMSG
ncbi:MAG: CpaF family protein [Sphingomonadales bacterium]